MPVTVNINGLSATHQQSNGIAMATVPDVCKTPAPPGPPIPIPYPNIAMSSDLVQGTTTVMIDGASAAIQGSKFAKSTGDEPGVAGGIVSGVFAMEATFISFSPTVMLDGKPACRLTDKMLMNKGNTVCMGGVLQAPVPPGTPPDADPNAIESVNPEMPKHCVLRGVIVKCGHDKRNLTLDLSASDIHVLEIVSKATEPDKLAVEWDGDCGDHHSYCPSVTPKGQKDLKSLKKQGEVELAAPGAVLGRNWIEIFKHLATQKDVRCDYYTINSTVCMGGDTANVGAGQWLQVKVYPEMSVKADVTLGYKHGNLKNAEGKETFEYEASSTWVFGGSVDVAYGPNKFTYSLETETKADPLPMFGGLLKLIGRTAKIFESMGTFGASAKLKPRWPKWTISGGGLKLAERTGKPIVGVEGDFKFGFDPLFGLDLEVSILDWLILFAGGLAGPPGIAVAKMLTELRERFAKGAKSAGGKAEASLDIDIQLIVGGELFGGFGMKYKDGKADIDPEAARIGGKVGVKVEGHVIGKARIWKFEASGAGKVGAASADGKEESQITAALVPKGGKDPLAPKGEISFNGLAFYYALYLEVGGAGA